MAKTAKSKKESKARKNVTPAQVEKTHKEMKAAVKEATEQASQTAAPKQVQDSQLSPVYRVLTFTDEVWSACRQFATDQKISTRQVIRQALNEGLSDLVEQLAKLGFSSMKATHRVRASLDASILHDLATASSKTGVPAVELLRLVLARALVTRKG